MHGAVKYRRVQFEITGIVAAQRVSRGLFADFIAERIEVRPADLSDHDAIRDPKSNLRE